MQCPRCGAPATPGVLFCSACGGPVSAANPGAAAPSPSGSGARTAIVAVIIGLVVLFGVGVIGIIAAIFIPNFLMAQQRARQKRTLADLRGLVAAIEQYQTDTNHYPAATDIDGLCAALREYQPACPRTDGWSTPAQPRRYAYAAWGTPADCAGRAGDSQCGPLHYGLASAGKDGLYERPRFTDYERQTTYNLNSDLVAVDSEFIRQPGGAQHDEMIAGGSSRPPDAPTDSAVSLPPQPASPITTGPSSGNYRPEGQSAPGLDAGQAAAQTRTQLAEMRSALAGYFDSRREYPSPQDAEELCILLRSRGLRPCSPNDAWGRPLRYQSWKFPARNNPVQWIAAFVLISDGPDGKPLQVDPREFLQANGEHGDDLWVYGGYDPDWSERHGPHQSAPSPAPLSLPAN